MKKIILYFLFATIYISSYASPIQCLRSKTTTLPTDHACAWQNLDVTTRVFACYLYPDSKDYKAHYHEKAGRFGLQFVYFDVSFAPGSYYKDNVREHIRFIKDRFLNLVNFCTCSLWQDAGTIEELHQGLTYVKAMCSTV